MTINFGILPFDTTDDSVVFRNSLTSLATITDAGGLDLSTANNVFDSVKGISPRINGSNISGVRFRDINVTEESGDMANLPEGQISIEIERAALCIPSSVTNSESNGLDNDPDDVAIMVWTPSGTGNAQFGYVYKRNAANDYDIFAKAGGGGSLTGAKKLGAQTVRSQWAVLTVTWDSQFTRILIDGFEIHKLARAATTNALTQFGDIYIGSYGGGSAVTNWNNTYFMRNLIISSRQVTQFYHPSLSHVMSVGDSFAGGQYQIYTNTVGECNEINIIAGRLSMAGYAIGQYTVYANGGGTVRDAGGDPLQDDVNGGAKTRATAASEHPTFIIFQGGVNDAGAYDAAFLTDLKDHVMEFMADGTTYTGNYRAMRMILIAQVTGTSLSANMISLRDDVKSIPAWWDATYPTRAGHVGVVDMDYALDGTTVKSEFMQSDNVHPNSLGDYLFGDAVSKKMLQMIG